MRHNVPALRVQPYRNRDMMPENKKAALEAKLDARRALVIEEVSMISPALYNMLLFRFYHGRLKRWQIPQERYYVQKLCAFGCIPLVLHLGDFLQLRPTAAMSLLTDLTTLPPTSEDKKMYHPSTRMPQNSSWPRISVTSLPQLTDSVKMK